MSFQYPGNDLFLHREQSLEAHAFQIGFDPVIQIRLLLYRRSLGGKIVLNDRGMRQPGRKHFVRLFQTVEFIAAQHNEIAQLLCSSRFLDLFVVVIICG